MPSTPELTYAAREIWATEILHQTESEYSRDAYCYQRIAREITVNLEREQQGCQQISATVMHLQIVEYGVYIQTATVCKHQLHEISPDHQFHAGDDIVVVETVFPLELRQQIVGTLDGTRYQLGEKGNEKCIGEEITFHLRRPAENIYGIAQRLESIERNAHRKQQPETWYIYRQSRSPQGSLYVGTKEIVILEQEKNRKVQHYAGYQTCFLLPDILKMLNSQGCQESNYGARQEQQSIAGLPVHIEIVACCEKEQISQPYPRCRNAVEQQTYYREENQE